MTTEYTQNFRLNKPDFRTSPWSSYLNDNADRLDALIYNSLQANGTSVYDNGVAVAVGQIMYDPDLNTFWVNTIAHTTEATGDFNDDRVENPGAWVVLHFAWTPRGQWAHSTVYNFYDVAYDPDDGITAVCIDPHSSGATGTINDEIDKWIVIADNSEITAALIAFDNTGTSLVATDVQTALAELDTDLTNEVAALQSDIDSNANNITTLQNDVATIVEPPQGRLTLLSNNPVMTSTQSAKTTIYYTPYIGNLVPIYNGTKMVPTVFSELSTITTDTTKSPAAIGASKVNDWFVWNDAGTIRISHGPDWTDDVTRSAGSALTRVNGIWVNNVDITNGPAAQHGTYIGTTRSNASSQFDYIFGGIANGGVAAFLGVWNAYNRVQVSTSVTDNTSTWTYSSATIRPFNNSVKNRISYVCGLAEDIPLASFYVTARPASDAGTDWGDFGWGKNITNARTSPLLEITLVKQTATTVVAPVAASLGFNYIQAVEASNGSTNITVVGSGNCNALTLQWMI